MLLWNLFETLKSSFTKDLSVKDSPRQGEVKGKGMPILEFHGLAAF